MISAHYHDFRSEIETRKALFSFQHSIRALVWFARSYTCMHVYIYIYMTLLHTQSHACMYMCVHTRHITAHTAQYCAYIPMQSYHYVAPYIAIESRTFRDSKFVIQLQCREQRSDFWPHNTVKIAKITVRLQCREQRSEVHTYESRPPQMKPDYTRDVAMKEDW